MDDVAERDQRSKRLIELASCRARAADRIARRSMYSRWRATRRGAGGRGLVRRIGTASAGRINIEIFPAGVLVRPFETFDAVGAGVADMYHSAEYYWEKKSPAFS
ncbi:MAG TPA: hypothetical protein VF516_09485, partial [Kofleriaceae bacterium]